MLRSWSWTLVSAVAFIALLSTATHLQAGVIGPCAVECAGCSSAQVKVETGSLNCKVTVQVCQSIPGGGVACISTTKFIPCARSTPVCAELNDQSCKVCATPNTGNWGSVTSCADIDTECNP